MTDRIKAGEINPKWCPTGEMIADFLTKPLQGRIPKIQGFTYGNNAHSVTGAMMQRSVAPQECVGRRMHEYTVRYKVPIVSIKGKDLSIHEELPSSHF